MIRIDTGQLKEEADQLMRCFYALEIQIDELAQVSRALQMQTPLEESIPKLHRLIIRASDNNQYIIQMSRSLDQIASLYEHCERRIESNCEGRTETPLYHEVDIPVIPFKLLQ